MRFWRKRCLCTKTLNTKCPRHGYVEEKDESLAGLFKHIKALSQRTLDPLENSIIESAFGGNKGWYYQQCETMRLETQRRIELAARMEALHLNDFLVQQDKALGIKRDRSEGGN